MTEDDPLSGRESHPTIDLEEYDRSSKALIGALCALFTGLLLLSFCARLV